MFIYDASINSESKAFTLLVYGYQRMEGRLALYICVCLYGLESVIEKKMKYTYLCDTLSRKKYVRKVMSTIFVQSL